MAGNINVWKKGYVDNPEDFAYGEMKQKDIHYETLKHKKLKKKAIAEFEEMREMAELKALSKASLERPLSECEYKRFVELGKKRLGKVV